MFQVTCGSEWAKFSTLDEAKSFAEKTSWIQSLPADIRTPEGKILKIKVGNVP